MMMRSGSEKRSFSTSNLFDDVTSNPRAKGSGSGPQKSMGSKQSPASSGLSSDARLAQLQLEVSRLQRELSLRQSAEEMKMSNLEERHRRALKRLEADHESQVAALKGARLEQELADRHAHAGERALKLEAQCQQLKLSLKAAERQLSRSKVPQNTTAQKPGKTSPVRPPRAHSLLSDSNYSPASQHRRAKGFSSPQKSACCETLRLELQDREHTVSELRQKHAEKAAESDRIQSKLSEVRAHARESARAHEVAQTESQQEIKTLNEEIVRLKEYLTVAETRMDAQTEKNKVLKHTIDTRLEALQNEFSEKITHLETELDQSAGTIREQESLIVQLRHQFCVYWDLIVSVQGNMGDLLQGAQENSATLDANTATEAQNIVATSPA